MRRLFLAAALALAFHSLLFTMKWEGSKAKHALAPRPLTLSLAQGPTEPRPSLAVAAHPEPPLPPPLPFQVPEEKPRIPKTRKPEKPAQRTDSSVPARQEQTSPSAADHAPAGERIPVSGPVTTSSSPPLASLGEGEHRSQPPPVHEATPLYRLNPLPEYPLTARKRGYQGTVILEVLVDREGRVADLRLSASCGYSVLDQAALAGVKTWLFEPGTRGGENVEMWVKVPVRFRLD